MKDIQDWLGLSSYATTANIYAHLDTDSKKQPATKMNQTVSITSGISAAIQAGGENSRREPGFKKKILRFSIHEKPEYFQLSCVDKKDASLYPLHHNDFRKIFSVQKWQKHFKQPRKNYPKYPDQFTHSLIKC